MSRSLKKGPYIDAGLIAKIEKLDSNRKKEPIKTWAR
ncbi:ribosomal protein S19 family protein, partial [Schlesneria sp.]